MNLRRHDCCVAISGVLFAFAAILLHSTPASAQRDISGRIAVKGQNRSYLLHLPEGKEPSKATPLFIVLHGGMENAAAIRKMTGFNHEADRSGFIVAYPNGSGRLKKKFLMWNSIDCCGYAVAKRIDDVAFMDLLIEKLASEYKIDRERVYICGYSNGAMLALRLACELSGKVAAVASVGGSMSGKEKFPASPVSILMIHGTDDRHVPYEGGTGKWARIGYPVNEKSVAYALDFWKKADGCQGEPARTEDGMIKTESYRGKLGTDVKLVTLVGARHTWPGGKQSVLYSDRAFNQLNASRECCRFLLQHSRVDNSSG